MTRVKICGITRPEDAVLSASLGAHAIGMIFAAESPRYLALDRALRIADAVPPLVGRVGVFVNSPAQWVLERVHALALSAVQLCGEEPPSILEDLGSVPVIRAIGVRDEDSLAEMECWPVAAHLIDAHVPGRHGGTGKTVPVDLARAAIARCKSPILAGGLGPENVAERIELLRPYAVDVSSGVEAEPGIKDPDKLRAFFHAVRAASHQPPE